MSAVGGHVRGSGEGGDGFGEGQTGNGDFAVAAVEGAEADGGRLGVLSALGWLSAQDHSTMTWPR